MKAANKVGHSCANSIKENADYLLKDIEDETVFLANNAYIQDLLSNYSSSTNDKIAKLQSGIDKVLKTISTKKKDEINSIEIVSSSFDSLFKLRTDFAWYSVDYKKLDSALGKNESVWLDYSTSKSFYSNTDQTLVLFSSVTYLKRIRDPNNKVIGVIIIQLKNNMWNTILKDTNVNIHILNNNNIIYQYESVKVAEDYYNVNKIILSDGGDIVKNINDKGFMVTYVTSDYNGWRYICYTSTDSIMEKINRIKSVIVLWGLICLICITIFSFSMSYRFTIPVNKTIELIEKIKKGNIKSELQFKLKKSYFYNKYIIMLVYSAITILPMIITAFMIFNISSNIIEKLLVDFYQNKMEQTSKNIDIKLQNYNYVEDYLFGNKNLNLILLKRKNNEYKDDVYVSQINDILNNVGTVSSKNIGVTLFDENKNFIYSTYFSQAFLKEQLTSIDNNKDNSTLWLSTVYDYGTYLVNYGKRMVAFDYYNNTDFLDNIGYIVLTINEQLVEDLYKSNMQEFGDKIFIADENGKIISSPDKAQIRNTYNTDYFKIINNSINKNGCFIFKNNGIEKVVAFSKLNSTGWVVLGELPLKLLNMDSQRKQNLFFALVLLNVVIPALLIVLLINKILGPINEIIRAMRNVANCDLDTRVHILTGNEIQRLSEGFNLMVSKLKGLMEENYKEGIRRKEAELNALQAQINPHFLYNTLESINWGAMMLTNGPNKVSDMVTALSDLLRLSINRGKEIVTIEEEVNHVQSYLLIQQGRYNEKFDVEWQINTDLYKYKTIKLILQPLVENSIYHGLETYAGKGKIKIMGDIIENGIKMVIADNGIGMSEEILNNIRISLEGGVRTESNDRSIGLKNVNDRIQLYFGEEYGIKVFSEEGKGTMIEIYLPLYEDTE